VLLAVLLPVAVPAGREVAQFKAQNMSLNSFVNDGSAENRLSQVIQRPLPVSTDRRT